MERNGIRRDREGFFEKVVFNLSFKVNGSQLGLVVEGGAVQVEGMKYLKV